MSLPKRGSRRVEVDGRAYRWLIRKAPTYSQGVYMEPMTVAVQAEDGRGVLHVDLAVSRPDNWIDPHQTAVTPHVVRLIVRAAQDAGWRPEADGTFEFRFPLIKDRM